MKRILFLVAVMMAILSLAGCKQDQGTDNDSTDSAASVTVPDPEGTVTVNITSSSFIYITNAPLRLSDGNLEVHNAAEDFRSLVSLGKGNGLGNLKISNPFF